MHPGVVCWKLELVECLLIIDVHVCFSPYFVFINGSHTSAHAHDSDRRPLCKEKAFRVRNMPPFEFVIFIYGQMVVGQYSPTKKGGSNSHQQPD